MRPSQSHIKAEATESAFGDQRNSFLTQVQKCKKQAENIAEVNQLFSVKAGVYHATK